MTGNLSCFRVTHSVLDFGYRVGIGEGGGRRVGTRGDEGNYN